MRAFWSMPSALKGLAASLMKIINDALARQRALPTAWARLHPRMNRVVHRPALSTYAMRRR